MTLLLAYSLTWMLMQASVSYGLSFSIRYLVQIVFLLNSSPPVISFSASQPTFESLAGRLSAARIGNGKFGFRIRHNILRPPRFTGSLSRWSCDDSVALLLFRPRRRSDEFRFWGCFLSLNEARIDRVATLPLFVPASRCSGSVADSLRQVRRQRHACDHPHRDSWLAPHYQLRFAVGVGLMVVYANRCCHVANWTLSTTACH